MKKIRLTEKELTNIIKRVINEQPTIKNAESKIPQVIKEKGTELARMAQNIINMHMKYCQQMKLQSQQMKLQNPETGQTDCEFVTKRFKEQPLWVIANLDKSLNAAKSLPTQTSPVRDPYWETK